MTNTRQPVKSELQLKMEADGWTWISDVSCPTNSQDDVDSGENEDFFKEVRSKYKFIKVTEAYNFEGKVVPELVAVYAKGKRADSVVS